MTADKIFPVPENYKNSAHVTKVIYEDLCQQAEADSEKFWGKIGKRVDWIKLYSKIFLFFSFLQPIIARRLLLAFPSFPYLSSAYLSTP